MGTVNGSGYLSTMGNSIAFQELGSGNITDSETSGNSAGAGMDGYGDDFDSGHTEIIITQNAQTIGGETVFSRDGLWEEEESYCVVDLGSNIEIRDAMSCDYAIYDDNGNEVQAERPR